jgi:hypothetical protein
MASHLIEDCPEKVFSLGVWDKEFNTYDSFRKEVSTGNAVFYFGHFSYGVHRFFDSPVSYMANMRRPMDRLISGLGWKKRDQTLQAYLAQSFETHNGMTKRLAGLWKAPASREDSLFIDLETLESFGEDIAVDDKIFERARNVLENQIDDIFIVEFMEECQVLFEKKYDLLPLFSLRSAGRNSTAHSLKQEELPSDLINHFDSNNVFDQRLYDLACAKLKEKLSDQSPEFWEEVRIRKIAKNILGRASLARTPETIMKKLGEGFQNLHFFGMAREILLVADLCTHDPLCKQPFRDVLAQVVDRLVPAPMVEAFRTAHPASTLFATGRRPD